MKLIYLITCLLMHLRLTVSNNNHHNTASQEYSDVFLLLDENEILDEMLDQAWLEINGSGDENKGRKTVEIDVETSGVESLARTIPEQSGEHDGKNTSPASEELVSGSGGLELSGDDQKHHRAHRPIQQMDTGCGCEGETCECCLDVGISDKNGDVCVQVTLLRAELGLKFSVTWKGETAFSKTISAVNPPSICFSIPFIRFLKACIRFSEISYEHNKFGGCISLELKLLAIQKEFRLGCFYTPNATSLGPKQDKHSIKVIKKTRKILGHHRPFMKTMKTKPTRL